MSVRAVCKLKNADFCFYKQALGKPKPLYHYNLSRTFINENPNKFCPFHSFI